MRKPWVICLALLGCLALAACGGNTSPKSASSTANTANDLIIDTAALQVGDVEFVPFGNGNKARILVAKTSKGVVAKLDTCNSCNGSPMAYYASDGKGNVVCQNCGFEFALDELDHSQGGCSPMDIAHEVSGDQVRIASTDLSEAEPLFSAIQR